VHTDRIEERKREGERERLDFAIGKYNEFMFM
jgi:hypothetical protein